MPAKVRGLISNGNFNQLPAEVECNRRKIHFISCCPYAVVVVLTFNADLVANGDPMQDTLHMQAWEGMQQ